MPEETKTASKSTRSTAKKSNDPVVYISRESEPTSFDVCGIRPVRVTANGKLEWTVPADKADVFETHHHCVTNRIVRK